MLIFAAVSVLPDLKCIECGRVFPIARKAPWCDCGGLFELDFKPERLHIDTQNFTFWRYRDALPVQSRITIGEAVTPIIQLTLDDRTVDAKLEYALPTGSFKDRGAAILISALKDASITRFMEDSSGNAGAAMAAYAARAGIRCEIYCPASASPAKLIQAERAGAEIHKIAGSRDQTTSAVRSRAGEVFYASHNWHPLFLHGTKTMAYEIAEQYGWEPPAHIVAPTGGGSVLLGLRLGFTELIALGRIQRMPKLHAVQAEACAPLVHEAVRPVASLAEGILTSNPPRLSMMRNVIDGVAVVSEPEVLDGFRRLCRQGLNLEPTSAVVFHGFRKLHLPPEESALLIITGSGLKSGVV